jgi:hypothetical protein
MLTMTRTYGLYMAALTERSTENRVNRPPPPLVFPLQFVHAADFKGDKIL